jgi:hypothetical protein
MKDRLKKKLKAKKILGGKHRSVDDSKNAVRRKTYEMPQEYKQNLQKLSELLAEREEYEQLLKDSPPDVRAEALPILREYDAHLDKIEQALATEYDDHQNRQSKIEETEIAKQKAYSRLREHLQRMFIVAKHKFEPELFEKFEKQTLGHLSPEAREEFYDEIAVREAYDLEHILANPNGGIKRPMKHPQEQLAEAMFEIDRIAFETDDSFKEVYAEYENTLEICRQAEQDYWLYMPDQRPQYLLQIEDLDRQREKAKKGMMEYLEICFAEDGKVEIENPDQEKLDAAIEAAEVAHERVFIYYKHCRPEVFEKFVPVATAGYDTPEEIAKFYERVAKREAEELEEILAASKAGIK